MEYFTADKYVSWTRDGEPFDKNDKLYTKVSTPCPRCGGSGMYHGMPRLGVCYKCGGSGRLIREARLYTAKERDQMERQKARAAERREIERKNFLAVAKEKWLEKNGFTATGKTFMALGDTFNIKDSLKEAGFKYNDILGWHNTEDCGFECAEVVFEDVYSWNYEAAAPSVKENAHARMKEIRVPKIEISTKFYDAEVGDRIRDIPVTLADKKVVDTQYGVSTMYAFKGADDAWFIWWTTSNKYRLNIGDKAFLTGTIKAFNEYNGYNQTVLTRCKIESV